MSEAALALIETCEGCGACCRRQGSPPGFAACLSGQTERAYPEDLEILASAPASLVSELADHYRRAALSGDTRLGKPCLWFDETTRGCRHYEFRPILCREFERGSVACHDWRRRLGVGTH